MEGEIDAGEMKATKDRSEGGETRGIEERIQW